MPSRPSAVLISAAAAALVATGGIAAAVATPNPGPPRVTGLSSHHAPYWGYTKITVRGQNFNRVRSVEFGGTPGWGLSVTSPTALTIGVPEHAYGTVNLRVFTAWGASPKVAADEFTFTRISLDTPIQGGLTAHQEQRISAQLRAAHHTPATAYDAGHWTSAMGLTAARRAKSWLGLPYSWAGGSASGPTAGVCEHNGGDVDCHVIGFDCSGLSLYAWSPYKTMDHYAQTQHSTAGRFHPAAGELVPGDLVFFGAYLGSGIGHVAIYVGRGLVVEAPQSGSQVRVSRLDDLMDWDGYRGATRPTSTGRQGAAPVVRSITPTGTGGGWATVTGDHLDSAISVAVGDTRTYWITQRSAHRMTVHLPGHAAGSATVAVSGTWGTAKHAVSYVGAPRLDAVYPASGPVAGGQTINLGGRSLDGVTRVTVDGQSASFRHSAGGHLRVHLPAHAAGTAAIVVSSPYGTSRAIGYRYLAPVAPKPTTKPTTVPKPSPTSTSKPTSPKPTASSAPGRPSTPTASKSPTPSKTSPTSSKTSPTATKTSPAKSSPSAGRSHPSASSAAGH